MIDRLYYCVFRFLQITPSREMGHEMTAVFMGLMLTMHVQAILMAPELLEIESLRIPRAKVVFVVCMVVFIGLSLYRFIFQRRGEDIVRQRQDLGRGRFAALVGGIIFFETLLLPILAVLVVGAL